MNKKTTVALIYGGRGRERKVSLRGAAYALPILKRKYSTLPIHIDSSGRWLLEKMTVYPASGGFITEGGERIEADCAVPLLHGDYGEDGIVQGALENATIPFVGCDTAASAVCRDKFYVKIIAERLGIPTLPCLCVSEGDGIESAIEAAERAFPYPLFIKPCRLGSSVGASAAKDRDELCEALRTAFSLSTRVLIEPCLTDKRELECGYFSANCKEIFTYPGEILINGSYGYAEKYLKTDTRLAVRSDIDEATADRVREYARRLCRALCVRDIARIDFFLSGDRLYFNEINTFPGFTSGSLYPRMLEAAGLPIADALEMLIETAILRG